MKREMMFPVVAKLKWQDQMAFDLGLSATDFRVGFAIGWALNKHTGRARISQDTLAVKLGVHVRAIQRSVDNLERRGHLQVYRRSLGTRKSDGRRVCGGRVAHHYEPIVKSGIPAPSVAPAGSTTNATTKDDSTVEKGRHGSRPFPLNPIYYPTKGRANARDDRGSLGGLPAVPDRGDRVSRLRGTEFEFWLADNLGCDHATIIAQVSPSNCSLCSAAMPLVTTLVKNSPSWPSKLPQSDARNRDERMARMKSRSVDVQSITIADQSRDRVEPVGHVGGRALRHADCATGPASRADGTALLADSFRCCK